MADWRQPRYFPAPLWFTRDADEFKRKLEAREITQERYDEEIEELNHELYYRNLEYRQGRG